MIASIIPRRSVLSTFELERRRSAGNETAAAELAREVLLDDVMSLKHAAEALSVVLVVVCALGAFGWLLGIIIALVIALLYGRLARIPFLHDQVTGMYDRIDPHVIRFVERYPRIGKILRTVNVTPNDAEVSSRDELEHLVKEARHILTDDEQKRILHGLHFSDRTVEEIMTPRGVIETVARKELVGPLLLDQLHKTGHSRFPVIDGDIDHVVGVLHIKELLALGDKTSKVAGNAMDARVFYINQDQTLEHALAAFIKTRHHLFVVVNGYRETAGILTLEDVVEALIGHEIVDEFDVHDDLRIVAARNAKLNNNPPNATNV